MDFGAMEEFIDSMFSAFQSVRLTVVMCICSVGVCSHTLVIMVLLRKQVCACVE
jgi:hypothetical protein